MELQVALQELEQAGTPQNRKIYGRHGAREPLYGVSFAVLNSLQKKVKKDHALALELWNSHNYDAMILACKLADPATMTREQAEEWVHDAYCYPLSGEVASLVAKTPFAFEKAQAWMDADHEWIESTGWLVLANIAESDQLTDEYLLTVIERIERDIHPAKNRVRHEMNTALINIGLRPGLREYALAAAARIGKVNVDHGETGCVTPNVSAYIHKVIERRARKAGK